ncbi:hypothetical protein ACLOAV_010039 [Pseudogymnoascus australis]
MKSQRKTNQLNQVSSRTCGYEESCEVLRFDPTKPTVGNVALLPWQVTGPEWILRQ